MSVYRRISESARPGWADVVSVGTFCIEPESKWAGHYDEAGVGYLLGRFDPHYHEGDEYWLIYKGSGVVRIEDEQHAFGPGDIICIERRKVHDVVGVYEPVEGFWYECPVPPGAPTGHRHQAPEDAQGHVVPLLPRDGGGGA